MSDAPEIFDRMAPCLVGAADKLRRVREQRCDVELSEILLSGVARDIELVWHYLQARASIDGRWH